MKLRWLVPLILTASALLGWNGLTPQLFAGPMPPKASPPVALPVIVRTDAMPEVLVVGQTYEITFTVTFPRDWPESGHIWVHADDPRRDRSHGMTGMLYLCTKGYPDAAGATLTETCPFMPNSTGPLNIRLEGSERARMLGLTENMRYARLDFKHTVIAAP